MKVILHLFLSCFMTVSWADFLQERMRKAPPTTGGGTQKRPSNQSVSPENTLSCKHVRSLPIEFISLFAQNRKFEAQIKDGKIKFPPLEYRDCFLGGDAPVSIQAKKQNGHYIITAMITGHVTDEKGVSMRDKDGNEIMITTYEQLNNELNKCTQKKYNKEAYPEPMVEFDVTQEDETRLLTWGVAGNMLNVDTQLKLDVHSVDGDFINNSCFKKQDIAESNFLIYSKEGKKFEDIIGHCLDCTDTLAEEIAKNPGIKRIMQISRKLSIDVLQDEMQKYAEKVKGVTDIDELEDFEKSLLLKVKKILLGDPKQNDEGLMARYINLLDKTKEKNKDDKDYDILVSEKSDIENFFKFLTKNFSPEGEVVQHLKNNHAYNATKEVGWLGIVAGVANNPENKTIMSSKRMLSGIVKKHQEWVAKSLEPHQKKWQLEKRLQYAREHPEAKISDTYGTRYSEIMSRYRDLDQKNTKLQRKATKQAYEACSNTKSFGPFSARLGGPYTSSARKKMYHNCKLSKQRLSKGSESRHHEMQRLLQQAQAFGSQARLFKNAEMEGIRKAREKGKFFDDGFGYSDDLYSPFMNDFKFYREHGSQNTPMPPSFIRGGFGYDPRLNLIGNNFATYPNHSNFSPNIFNNGPPSYAMPPNFNNSGLWGQPSPFQRRGPAGWYDPHR